MGSNSDRSQGKGGTDGVLGLEGRWYAQRTPHLRSKRGFIGDPEGSL